MSTYVEGSSMIKQRTGVGQFTKRLLEAYGKEYPEAHIKIFGFKFFTQGEPEYPIKSSSKLEYNINRWLPGRVYNQLFKYNIAPPIDLLLGARKSDVFLYPNFVQFPMLYNNKSMLMIHDLSFVHFSQFTHPKDLPYKLKYVPASVKKASRIITISENSKKEIMEYYGVEESRISLVHPAVDTKYFYRKPQKDIQRVRKKYCLPSKYILYAGTIEPRKNIDGLLNAYASLDKSIISIYGLVLAGGKGWQDDGILERIQKLKDSGFNIVQTGYVPDEDLPAIYSGATLFVFPSHYEGFGIPPLEAMACGVPVISANNSSLSEAVGDAGILVDASNTQQLGISIESLIRSGKRRKELVNKGYVQLKKFTWEKAARELNDAINLVR